MALAGELYGDEDGAAFEDEVRKVATTTKPGLEQGERKGD